MGADSFGRFTDFRSFCQTDFNLWSRLDAPLLLSDSRFSVCRRAFFHSRRPHNLCFGFSVFCRYPRRPCLGFGKMVRKTADLLKISKIEKLAWLSKPYRPARSIELQRYLIMLFL